MTAGPDREHFIPVRDDELIELLCGDVNLTDADRQGFREFCRRITALYHFDYLERLKKLKAVYAPFDPDAITRPLTRLTADQRQQQLNILLQELTRLMERANYRHLSIEELEPALDSSSYWGFRTDVKFRAFERLAIFVRGDTVETRKRRRVRNRWREEKCEVPIYQRVVMFLKLRQHPRLGRHVDTESVYLQIFKNIPKLDVKMLLPGARARLTYFDRGKISFPLLSGLSIALLKIFQDMAAFLTHLAEVLFLQSPWAAWTLASGSVGYGIRSYYGWQQTKQTYNAALTQMLYFQNLDTNAGVLYRVLDEAEEQDCREVLLAYYYLWRYGGTKGWTGAELVRYIETDLEQHCQLKVDFDIDATIRQMERLRLVEKVGDRHRARPLDEAMRLLGTAWDAYFETEVPERKAREVSVED